MRLYTSYLTENNCYKANKKHTVKGIMVHSTGANNPYLNRYISPDDGLIGVNKYNNHWNMPKPEGKEVCVHAFIGKQKDGSVATYQTLPWDTVGWHSGSGYKGYTQNANNTGYIGFEICEDALTDATYFGKVYTEAVELCVYLCKQYNLTEKDIICHSEGHTLGIASNHGDIMHWWPKFGKNMDIFRSDVKAGIQAIDSIKKNTNDKEAGINTWTALSNLDPVDSAYFVYTVVKGDTLWKLSKKYLGKGRRYTEIAELNDLKNNTIISGQELKIPNF